MYNAAPMRSPWSCAEVNAVVEMLQKGVSTYPFLPTPRWALTRIAVGMAVSKAGYLLALSNLCGTAHLPLFVDFGRAKDIRPGNLSAPFSGITSRCSADLAVTIYREGSLICLIPLLDRRRLAQRASSQERLNAFRSAVTASIKQDLSHL